MNLLFRLLRLFCGKPNVIQTRNGVFKLPVKSLRPHWIVGRDLCMYRREDFANVPRNRRRSALDLKVSVWSPFERTGYHCVWSGSSAMVWFWDGERVGSEGGGEALDSRRRDAGAGRWKHPRVLPETVFREKKSDGTHLQACQEGFELQYWRVGALADAFWFPDRPDERGVRWFLGRQEGDAHAASLENAPEVSDAGIAPEPWSSSRTPGEWLEVNERAIVAACLLALSVAVVWQESRFWKIHHLKEKAAGELALMQDELGPLLEARNELLRLRLMNRTLSDILGEPSQARLMSLVDRAIPSPTAQFRGWHYQQRELRVIVEDPDPDPIAYVRSLEAEPLFEQVRAEPLREGRIQITLRVRA